MSEDVLGKPTTGLAGPYAFPFGWTFQRRRALQHTSRRHARHLARLAAGMPLYIEAVTPPLKALRGELNTLALAVACHQGDIGYALLHRLFPGPDDGCWIDFADTSRIDACPRYGTRWFLQRQYRRFWRRYAELQGRAIANGRYFPPPVILRARVAPIGSIRIDMGFATGYLPGDRIYVLSPSENGYKGRAWLLSPDEPLPRQAGLRGFLLDCAKTHARPGEEIWLVGSAWIEIDRSRVDIREGDALVGLIEEDGLLVALRWNGIRVANAWEGRLELREWIRKREPFGIRVARLDFMRHGFHGELAYAVYGPKAHRS